MKKSINPLLLAVVPIIFCLALLVTSALSLFLFSCSSPDNYQAIDPNPDPNPADVITEEQKCLEKGGVYHNYMTYEGIEHYCTYLGDGGILDLNIINSTSVKASRIGEPLPYGEIIDGEHTTYYKPETLLLSLDGKNNDISTPSIEIKLKISDGGAEWWSPDPINNKEWSVDEVELSLSADGGATEFEITKNTGSVLIKESNWEVPHDCDNQCGGVGMKIGEVTGHLNLKLEYTYKIDNSDNMTMYNKESSGKGEIQFDGPFGADFTNCTHECVCGGHSC